MAKSILILVSILALILGSNGYTQELIVHMSIHQNGTHHLFRESVPNVPVGILDGAASYCTRGFWVVYNGINYEGTSTELHGTDAEWDCHDKPFPFKSFRFGGNLETTVDGLSVFPQEGYQGTEVTVTGPALAILTGKSIVFTQANNWTIYEGQNFFGTKVCATLDEINNELELQGHTNVTESLGLGLVGSVIRGCHAFELEASLAEYYAQQ